MGARPRAHGFAHLFFSLCQAGEERIHPLKSLLVLIPGPPIITSHQQVFFHRHVGEDPPPFRNLNNPHFNDFMRREEINPFPIKKNLSAGDGNQGRDGIEHGTFPGCIRSDQADNSALANCQGDIL
jgi:hypothetical protein